MIISEKKGEGIHVKSKELERDYFINVFYLCNILDHY